MKLREKRNAIRTTNFRFQSWRLDVIKKTETDSGRIVSNGNIKPGDLATGSINMTEGGN